MRNMVSKISRLALPLVASLLCLFGCDKPYSIEYPLAVDSNAYNITAKAGKTRVFFYTDRAWTVSLEYEPATRQWASLDKYSGNGEADVEALMLTYEKNPYQERKVTIVINAGDLQEEITFTQAGEGGIDPALPPFKEEDVKEWTDGSSSVEDLNVVKPQ